MKIILVNLILISFVVLYSPSVLAQQVDYKTRDTANYYFQIGLDKMKDGDTRGGLEFLEKAVNTNPYDINARVKYIEQIRKNATDVFKNHSKTKGYDLFKDLEKELLILTKLLLDKDDKRGAANTYYQIGNINEMIFLKERIADAYYNKALNLDPNHTPSKSALRQ